MEAVLSIPELVDLLLTGKDEIHLIAKLRMVCIFTRDLFATTVAQNVKTRCGGTYTTTTYSVRGIFGREPYTEQPTRRGFLQKIQAGRQKHKVVPMYAQVVHVQLDSDSCGSRFYNQTEFNEDADEFVKINRLFGLKSESYEMLLSANWYDMSGMEASIIDANDAGVDVKVGDETHWLENVRCIPHEFETHSVYYLFFGQVHGYTSDIGHYDNLQRMHKIKW